MVIVNREESRDGVALAKRISKSSISVVQGTPATWRMLIDAGWEGGKDLKLLCGGEAMPKDLAVELIGRGKELWNMFGPTETTVWSTAQRVSQTDQLTIGGPVANTKVYILDEGRKPVPVGVLGEVYIEGKGLARGYSNEAGQTAERFVPDSFDSEGGGRLYRTGDLGRWRGDGEIEYLGRRDQQVKVRGYRIELAEVEVALRQQHGVGEAAVIARQDRSGMKVLVGYVEE
jgi:non-ribosomal peptide synthetase component F